jgi:hypothetical protein
LPLFPQLRLLGSACVSRAGERVLALANFSQRNACTENLVLRKACFGATPKPTRETRALPTGRPSRESLRAFFEGGWFAAKMCDNFADEMQ